MEMAFLPMLWKAKWTENYYLWKKIKGGRKLEIKRLLPFASVMHERSIRKHNDKTKTGYVWWNLFSRGTSICQMIFSAWNCYHVQRLVQSLTDYTRTALYRAAVDVLFAAPIKAHRLPGEQYDSNREKVKKWPCWPVTHNEMKDFWTTVWKIIKFLTFASHENSVTNATSMRLLADQVMITMTVQNQHLTDERLAYSATLDLNNAWTFPACTVCVWQVVIAWDLTSYLQARLLI